MGKGREHVESHFFVDDLHILVLIHDRNEKVFDNRFCNRQWSSKS